MMKGILVPLDGSPLAESVLEPVASCAVSLVRGVEQPHEFPKDPLAVSFIWCWLYDLLMP